MTDYHPLIARAVEGLDKNSGEARRALYERARTALVTQLRAVDPPLSESDITRERLALEDAIRKVEADAARKARAELRDRGGHATAAPPPRRETTHVTSPNGPSRWRRDKAPRRRQTPKRRAGSTADGARTAVWAHAQRNH